LPDVDLAGMRRQYDPPAPLAPEDLQADPLDQLGRWLEEAVAAGEPSANAMLLSTVDAAGQPDARFVLLRGLDRRGLTFFTNYASPKARQLDAHPWAALTFGWLASYRQVRVTGAARRLPAAGSDAYFSGRPRATQIGSWASDQSAVIESRQALTRRVAEVERRFAGLPVPRPPHWGGYLVRPETVEFWQGQPDRLHDRLRYRRAEAEARATDGWMLERLSP
jgi:pyridoxamine 5'-phosphate oxidase